MSCTPQEALHHDLLMLRYAYDFMARAMDFDSIDEEAEHVPVMVGMTRIMEGLNRDFNALVDRLEQLNIEGKKASAN